METNSMIHTSRRLITGHRGFVGQHALSYWQNALTLNINNNESIDIRDYKSLEEYLSNHSPEEVLHLAGISFVPESIKNPYLTYEVNFIGTLNLLEALKKTGFKGKFLFVSSGDVYGNVSSNNLPITECHLTRPRNPYAVSKLAAENLCFQWSLNSPFEIIIARPFNHIGPGQSSNFVISDFSKQIAEISLYKNSDTIEVGNIDVTRDFSDVQDVLNAYDALFKDGKNGEFYNICSGKSFSIRKILDVLLKFSEYKIEIKNDPRRWRSTDQAQVSASNEKIYRHTGWTPQIPLENTLKTIYQYWEKKIG